MENAFANFVDRLFQPVALGVLLIILSPSVLLYAPQSTTGSELFATLEVTDQAFAPLVIAVGTLFAFLAGQISSVVGQFLFGYFLPGKRDDIRKSTFFGRVAEFDQDDFVRTRYNHIRFQVDLLCGMFGAGLMAAIVELCHADFATFNSIAASVTPALPVAAVAIFAAFFHARQFDLQLRDVEGPPT